MAFTPPLKWRSTLHPTLFQTVLSSLVPKEASNLSASNTKELPNLSGPSWVEQIKTR